MNNWYRLSQEPDLDQGFVVEIASFHGYRGGSHSFGDSGETPADDMGANDLDVTMDFDAPTLDRALQGTKLYFESNSFRSYHEHQIALRMFAVADTPEVIDSVLAQLGVTSGEFKSLHHLKMSSRRVKPQDQFQPFVSVQHAFQVAEGIMFNYSPLPVTPSSEEFWKKKMDIAKMKWDLDRPAEGD